MGLSADDWKRLYRRFDHKQRLQESESGLFVKRPGTVSDRILAELSLEPDGKWVVCGSVGSGKSTELVQLGLRLEPHHFVVPLDLPSTTDQLDKLTPAEVLFMIAAAAIRKAALDGHPIDGVLQQRLVAAFGQVSKHPNVDWSRAFDGVGLFLGGGVSLLTGNVPAGGAVTGAVKAAGESVRRFLPGGTTKPLSEVDPLLESLSEAVNAVLGGVHDARGPTVVLVDGLDKVLDLAAIRALFTQTRILTRPAVPVVYTGPITLMVGPEWNVVNAAFLPRRLTNVVVNHPSVHRAGLESLEVESGREAMRKVIGNRLEFDGFKTADVFTSDAVEELVTCCGGVLRDLVRLVNRCCEHAFAQVSPLEDGRIGKSAAAMAIQELRRELRLALDGRRIAELVHVKRHGVPTGVEPTSQDLLLTNYVLPYSNGDVWWEPHPLLGDIAPLEE